MNIAVCITNKDTLQLLSHLFELYQAQRQAHLFCRNFESEHDLLLQFVPGNYDVLFFSISNNSPLAEKIREIDARILLVCVSPTATDTPLLGNDFWYCLLEPIDERFLFPVLDRLSSDNKKQDEAGLVVQSKNSVTHIVFSQIEYVEVMGKNLYFHMVNNTIEIIRGTLLVYGERLLQCPDFMKIHRAYIVNMRYINKVMNDSLQTRCGHILPISKYLYPQFKQDYMCRLMVPFSKQTDIPVSKDAPSSLPVDVKNIHSILLVDDEESELLRWSKVLIDKGCHICTANTGKSALNLLQQTRFDCILLDVNLGNENGFDLCEALQKETSAPVIYLSVLADSENQIQGFAAGGIDYITKDTPAELFWQKVKTRIEMSQTAQAELCSGFLHLDLILRKAFLQNQPLPLTTVEFDLLHLLMQHPGTIYPPAKLYELIWGARTWDDGHTVQLHMSQLNRKLENAANGLSFIETVWGSGYRFIPHDD